MNSIHPDISIIVPIFNEEAELPGLLDSLSAQQNVRFELILCDGGSSDGSQQLYFEHAAGSCFPVRLIQATRGRGCQMNAGTAVASSGLLLFLHADSRFDECDALYKAVALYRRQTASGSRYFAARFSLRFRRSEHSPSPAWFYYEAKARLPRSDCIRGDQGFLLNRNLLALTGGFDESLPFLEDVRLVESLAAHVTWLLVPTVISTSARRFEKEGLWERQVLNAIIINSIATEWTEFFSALPGLYRCQTDTGRLQLHPILKGISMLIAGHDHAWCCNFWRGTGRHVAGNAWQIFFWLDVRRAFRAGKTAGEVNSSSLDFYRRRLEPFFQSRIAAFLAQSAVKLWLCRMLLRGTS